MEDIRVMLGDVKFSARAVAVIIKDGKILFQKRKNDKFWALPGGAIGTLERGADVVKRELYEETGEDSATIDRPLWFVEYFFTFDNKKQHQYIIGYLVDIPNDSKLLNDSEFDGIEEGKNIIYKWLNVETIDNEPIKPEYLKRKLKKVNKNFEFLEEED